MKLSEYLSRPGAVVSLAKAMGIAPALVSQWKNGVRGVPAERCPDIERATGGAVACEDLRPDLAEQWAYLRGTPARSEAQPAAPAPAPVDVCAAEVTDPVDCSLGDPRLGIDRRGPEKRQRIDRRKKDL